VLKMRRFWRRAIRPLVGASRDRLCSCGLGWMGGTCADEVQEGVAGGKGAEGGWENRCRRLVETAHSI
jgi:hypothetical protein